MRTDALGELAGVDDAEFFWDTAAYAGAPVLAGEVSVVSAGAVTGIGGEWSAPGWRTARSTSSDPWSLGSAAGLAGLGGVQVGASGEVQIAGLEWMGARVYDPTSRGFLSVDPLAPIPGAGWAGNPYAFAGNDPVHALDPRGLKPLTDAELQHYRDSNGITGWAKNNREYIAGGAMIVAGGALMITGVGGPAGAMLISVGADTIIQKATTGEVNWGEVGVSFAAGAVGGGFAAAKLGAATGGYQYATGPGPHTVGGFAGATARGGATGAAIGGVGGAAGHGIATTAGRVISNVRATPDVPTSASAQMDSFLDNGATVHHSPTATAIGDDENTLTNLARSQGHGGGHDVILHGTPDGEPWINGMVTHPNQIADAVRANPSYSEGQPINLVMCHGARSTAGELAQVHVRTYERRHILFSFTQSLAIF
ncbi:RHS repeat-associated core domain-containing protein [uncultured Friedmanniella sp.]|uniref:RHS repeat-associated core domain-containing protein n=1 Tax=uncultured Friedmanniella sp. TaxID=335381 RepID=UPI0035CB9262